jgi:predicted ester cyclase
MRGTGSGELGALDVSGRAIEVRGLTIYYFEDGRIAGHRQVVDRLSVMGQLGLLGAG